MNRIYAIIGVSGLVLILSLPSWAQLTRSQTITLSGTVETLDQSRRTLSIKKTDGTFETVEVPASAKRFDELKVGDKVTVTYNNTVSARLKPPGEPDVDTGRQGTTMGQEARPGGTTVVQRTMTATVSAVDKAASTVAVVGPNGWKYSRRVVDPAVLDKLKVGDKIDLTWNTDMAVSVE
jgi:hypothetical protein